MWYIFTMEYYKFKTNMKFAEKMDGFKNIILSEVTQTLKDIYGMYSLVSEY